MAGNGASTKRYHPIVRYGWVPSWVGGWVGENFVQGVVLDTGPRVYDLDERIVAAPISTLWT